MMPLLELLFGKRLRRETERYLRDLAEAPAAQSRQSIARSLARMRATGGMKVVLGYTERGEEVAAPLDDSVFVKTKEPRIEWRFSCRTGAQLTELLAKVEHVGNEIAAGRFYKRPGKWCAWCDYLPVCTGDKAAARETLIQIG